MNKPISPTALGKCPANFSALNPVQFLLRSAQVYPRGISVIYGDNQFTWSETLRRCKRLASALRVAGVKQGDTVLVFGRKHPRTV